MKLTEQEIDLMKDLFSTTPVTRAFLFGSYARAEGTNDSDIDILVELDYSKHIGLGFIKIKQDLENILHKNIDLVTSEGVSPYILPFINNDKKLIYERPDR